MKISKKKITLISIISVISVILICILLIFALYKTEIFNIPKNTINDYKKAEVEEDIQNIIDEVKQEIQENEEREATLADLKLKLEKQGYILNETTGKVKYNGYCVIINDNLKIEIVEPIETKVQSTIMKEDGENFELLIQIENKNGIESITDSDLTIDFKGKEKVAFDKILKDGQEYQMKVKAQGSEEEELYTIIASKKPDVVITNMDTFGNGTTKTVEIEFPENEKLLKYYSLNNGNTWQEYTGELNIPEEENRTITAKCLWKEGETIFSTVEKMSLIISDSLVSATGKAVMTNDTYYRVVIKDEEYIVHAYVEDGDTIFDSNKIYGDANDVATASEYAKRTIMVQVNGNLTINSGTTLTAYGTSYGGPKGMVLYVNGTLTNNGNISMTARGAKAPGQNVYLWKNTDMSYEYVPSSGAEGGAIKYSSGYNNGTDGINRQTGGGGSGQTGGGYGNSGAGAKGTSYSGGSGGGGYYKNSDYSGSPGNGGANGGAGGSGGRATTNGTSGGSGGAGNPGGSSYKGNVGGNGTGGLLILGANSIKNEGTITANGVNGGQLNMYGGGSGGGSLNIFYKETLQQNGTITANGGNFAGKGCISIGNISSGMYVEEQQ